MGCELFFDSFQTISQRRRNGVLTVQSSAGKTQLSCLDGRIVSVMAEQAPASAGVAQRLYSAGLLHERVFSLVHRQRVPLDQLAEMLVGRQFVSEAQFLRARAAHEMNIALALRFLDEPSLEFSARDVRTDIRFPWSVSPGELLMDMCELEADGDRFFRYMMSSDDERVTVVANGELARNATPHERTLFETIRAPREVRSLFGGLLNEAEVTEGLLALLELGLMEVRRQGVGEPEPVKDAPKAIPAAPISEQVIADDDDEALAEELELAPELDDSGALYEKIASEAIGSMLDGFDDLTLAVFQDGLVESPPAPAAARESEVSREDAPRPAVMRGEATTASSSVVSKEEAKAPAEAAPTVELRRKGLIERLVELNIHCMSGEMRERLAVGSMFAFLILFLLCSLTAIAPIETWLHSLEQFTSGANLPMIH